MLFRSDQIGPGATYGTIGGSPGVIVPPVVVAGGGNDEGTSALTGALVGGIQSVLDAGGNLITGLFGQNQQLIDVQANTTGSLLESLDHSYDRVSQMAQAGSAPQPAMQNPTPVVADAPAPAPAPIAYPTPAPAPRRCTTAPYTNLNEATGKCYAVVCASGKGAKSAGRWHVYQDGSPDVKVSSTC